MDGHEYSLGLTWDQFMCFAREQRIGSNGKMKAGVRNATLNDQNHFLTQVFLKYGKNQMVNNMDHVVLLDYKSLIKIYTHHIIIKPRSFIKDLLSSSSLRKIKHIPRFFATKHYLQELILEADNFVKSEFEMFHEEVSLID